MFHIFYAALKNLCLTQHFTLSVRNKTEREKIFMKKKKNVLWMDKKRALGTNMYAHESINETTSYITLAPVPFLLFHPLYCAVDEVSKGRLTW